MRSIIRSNVNIFRIEKSMLAYLKSLERSEHLFSKTLKNNLDDYDKIRDDNQLNWIVKMLNKSEEIEDES